MARKRKKPAQWDTLMKWLNAANYCAVNLPDGDWWAVMVDAVEHFNVKNQTMFNPSESVMEWADWLEEQLRNEQINARTLAILP